MRRARAEPDINHDDRTGRVAVHEQAAALHRAERDREMRTRVGSPARRVDATGNIERNDSAGAILDRAKSRDRSLSRSPPPAHHANRKAVAFFSPSTITPSGFRAACDTAPALAPGLRRRFATATLSNMRRARPAALADDPCIAAVVPGSRVDRDTTMTAAVCG